MSSFDSRTTGPSAAAALAADPAMMAGFSEIEEDAKRVEADKARLKELEEKYGAAKIEARAHPGDATATGKFEAVKHMTVEVTKELAASTAKLASRISKVSATTGVAPVKIIEGAHAYHENVETTRIVGMLKLAQAVDIVFVYDTTGSMKPYYDCLKNHVKDILGRIRTDNPNMAMRLGLVSYRDPEDGADHLRALDLQDSRTTLLEFAATTGECSGGGDECEDVIGGLDRASKFNWQFPNRIMFVCGDAPCHGNRYHHGRAGDRHPEGLGASKPVIERLIEKNVMVTFWRINGTTDTMISEFNKDAAEVFGATQALVPGDRPRDAYIATSDMSATDELLITASMRTTISKTVSDSMSRSSAKVKARGITHGLKAGAKVMGLSPIFEDSEESSARSAGGGSIDASMRSADGKAVV